MPPLNLKQSAFVSRTPRASESSAPLRYPSVLHFSFFLIADRPSLVGLIQSTLQLAIPTPYHTAWFYFALPF